MGREKHTPGPWSIGKETSFLMGEYARIQAGDLGIAIITCFEVTDAQEEANARLLAAAPELLRALGECFDELCVEYSGEDETLPCMRLAKAAIKKATE